MVFIFLIGNIDANFFNSDMANHQQKFHFVFNVYAESKRVILLLKAIPDFK